MGGEGKERERGVSQSVSQSHVDGKRGCGWWVWHACVAWVVWQNGYDIDSFWLVIRRPSPTYDQTR